MKKVLTALVLSGAMGLVPVMAQEKKDMPVKGDMPMKEGMTKGEGMTCCQPGRHEKDAGKAGRDAGRDRAG